jgi:hypothetical protein
MHLSGNDRSPTRSAQGFMPCGPSPGGAEMARAHRSLMELALSHPSWFDEFDGTDIDVCGVEQLVALLRTAPTEFVRGYLAGTLAMRVSISLMTGRPLF